MIATSEAIIGSALSPTTFPVGKLTVLVFAVLRMAKVRALWLNDMNKWFCLATIIVYLAQTALSIVSIAERVVHLGSHRSV